MTASQSQHPLRISGIRDNLDRGSVGDFIRDTIQGRGAASVYAQIEDATAKVESEKILQSLS